jgi:hypothetical protein
VGGGSGRLVGKWKLVIRAASIFHRRTTRLVRGTEVRHSKVVAVH